MAEDGKDKKETKTKAGVGRSWLRAFAWTVFALFAAFAVLVALLPAIATRIDYPELVFDLSTNFTGNASALISNKTARVKLYVSRGDEGGLAIHAEGTVLDWPFSADAGVKWRWRLFGVEAEGDAVLGLDSSPWKARANFAASSSGEWNASLEMPATRIDGDDPVTGLIVSRLDLKDVENLDYGAMVSIKANAECTRKLPVPKWSASVRIRDCDASLEASGTPASMKGLQTVVGASGIADHVDISPIFLRAGCIEGAGFSLSNAFANVRAAETSFLVTEAGAGFCGGDLRLYSLFLDPAKLNAGLTLFIDGLDAGETLSHFKGFSGEASGELHGKMSLYVMGGRKIKFGKAYLYSVPGETGTIKVYDPTVMVESLALAGLPQESRDNVAKALADLVYSSLSMRLLPEGSDSMALSFKVEGTSTHKDTTVPVSFEVTLHGDLEQLVNTGLKATTNKQGARRR